LQLINNHNYFQFISCRITWFDDESKEKNKAAVLLIDLRKHDKQLLQAHQRRHDKVKSNMIKYSKRKGGVQ
jgi:hypothetical protein